MTNSNNAPSLFANGAIGAPPKIDLINQGGKSLLDLLYDGFYLVFLLRSGHEPKDGPLLRRNIQLLMDEFERSARRINAPADDIYAAKYAYCALVDETILRSGFSIRDTWEREPLQLVFFGDQLAGENFFTRLDTLRNHGAASLQALEVFHYCLLLGFQGKYLLDAPEKLSYLTARLGDEIAFLRGKRNAFAPFWAIPDQIRHAIKNEVPLPILAGSIILLGALAFSGLNWMLSRNVNQTLAGYSSLIGAPAQAAYVTITLP